MGLLGVVAALAMRIFRRVRTPYSPPNTMFTINARNRDCGGCTRCCEGWLTGDAWGHQLRPGHACGWLGSGGCLIYENRPHNPCKTFLCEWKRLPSIPEWLWPHKSRVIMVARTHEQHEYIRLVECGAPIGQPIHAWAKEYSAQHGVNIVINLDDGLCVYSSSQDFRNSMAKIYRLVTFPVDQ
mgnify:FL=1